MKTGREPNTRVREQLEMLGKCSPPVTAKCFTKLGKCLAGHLPQAKAERAEMERPPRLDSKAAHHTASSPSWAKLASSPLILQLNQGLQQGMKPISCPAPNREAFPGVTRKLSRTCDYQGVIMCKTRKRCRHKQSTNLGCCEE